MEWFEIREGRIARRWGARDGASQARQLGFPQEPQASCTPSSGAAHKAA